MRRISILLLILSLFTGSAQWLHAQAPAELSHLKRVIPHFPRKPGARIAHPVRRAEAVHVPLSVSPNVVWVPCPPDAQNDGALCGNLPVPLDRKHPAQGTINLYFELYLHSGPGPAESAFLGNFGGPGLTTTGLRDYFLSIFGSILDAHDILLIDDRGRGSSGLIVCDELQYGTAAFNPAVADCAAQLANGDSSYGTGDIAQDADAVRAALGYDKVDYYGGSYGGADVTAYATRFGNHLRSIVLDASVGTPIVDQFRFPLEQWRTQTEPSMVTLDCQRSPTCSRDHPFPQLELDGLIWTVRLSPVEGDAYDAHGNLMHIRIDEDALLNYVLDNPTGNFTSTGEVLAATDSLWRGDPRPLLRLGVEEYFPFDYLDNGDPSYYSMGAQMATACVDMREPWKWSDSPSDRTRQFDATVSALPFWYFAPFSREAATDGIFSFFGRDCLYWQKPTASSPMAPPSPIYPFAPTLALTGDLDNRVPTPEVRKVAAFFPNSTLVPVAEAGHETVFWTQCAANLAASFIETLQVGDTTCAQTPETVWPAVGRFPLLAKDARPAAVDPGGHNQIGLAERKVVTVAVATATDALQRSVIISSNPGSGNGVGLRAGTFHTDYGATAWTTTLTDCALAKDIIVNGSVTWDVFGALTADLTVSGPGTAGGSLHVDGTWQQAGPVGNFTVSGTLGGKQVDVLVPEA